jgi:L-lactate dehydrogenase complex protein LldE
MFRPNVGFASASLLQQAGYEVIVPAQGCCGQPNFNGGDREGARAMARQVIATFEGFDYLVVPSCSCAAMIKVHYPELFTDDADIDVARQLARKTWELTSFLVEVAGFEGVDAVLEAGVAVHDSCSGLRELGVKSQPRALLAQVRGVQEKPLKNPEICCGFGGLFATKYPDISDRIGSKKLADVEQAGDVDVLVSTEPGCLMHLAGKLHREGKTIRALHIAEVLAGMTDEDAG